MLLSVDFYGELLGETTAAPGKILFILPAILDEYRITFDFYVSNYRNAWQGLFRVSNSTHPHTKPGTRAPSVNFNHMKLYVYYENGGKFPWIAKNEDLKALKWYNVELKQTYANDKWIFQFFLDGELLHKDILNQGPNTYTNVEVSAVNIEPAPPAAKVRNVKVWTSEGNVNFLKCSIGHCSKLDTHV